MEHTDFETVRQLTKRSLKVNLRWLAFLCGTLFLSIPSYSQMVNAGLKAGFNWSWTRSDDAEFRDAYDTKGVPGFNAGAVFSFQLKKRYFLHTELLYSTKGRILTGDLDLRDEVTYNYIEIPLIYQIHFKGSIGSARQYKWYAGVGPNFSYWLGGKGVVTHLEITDHDVPEIEYTIHFGERPQERTGQSKFAYVSDPRRIQVGVNIGGGIVVEPDDNRKIMVDLRFELGHSWLGGEESADYVFPTTFPRNLQTRNMGLRLSCMYLLQSNTDKKVRNKGKSNVIKKGKMLERRN